MFSCCSIAVSDQFCLAKAQGRSFGSPLVSEAYSNDQTRMTRVPSLVKHGAFPWPCTVTLVTCLHESMASLAEDNERTAELTDRQLAESPVGESPTTPHSSEEETDEPISQDSEEPNGQKESAPRNVEEEDEDGSDNEEYEDDDDEPVLKYGRIGEDVPTLLKKDSAACLCVGKDFMVL